MSGIVVTAVLDWGRGPLGRCGSGETRHGARSHRSDASLQTGCKRAGGVGITRRKRALHRMYSFPTVLGAPLDFWNSAGDGEHRPLSGNTLQLMSTSIDEGKAGTRHQIPYRARHQYFAS